MPNSKKLENFAQQKMLPKGQYLAKSSHSVRKDLYKLIGWMQLGFNKNPANNENMA